MIFTVDDYIKIIQNELNKCKEWYTTDPQYDEGYAEGLKKAIEVIKQTKYLRSFL